jgi:predicted CoA-binding protein
MNSKEQIDRFLKSGVFAVVGASSNPDKYGNKVLRCYLQNNMKAIPVNPREKAIEGVDCVASVMELPDDVESISVITPPQVTEQVVEMAARKGIGNVWMQPGAESAKAVEVCRKNNINVIADGSCILVVLGFHDS